MTSDAAQPGVPFDAGPRCGTYAGGNAATSDVVPRVPGTSCDPGAPNPGCYRSSPVVCTGGDLRPSIPWTWSKFGPCSAGASFTCTGAPTATCPLLAASGGMESFAVGEGNIYWTDGLTVGRWSACDRVASALARRSDTTLDSPFGFRTIALDSQYAYWVDEGGPIDDAGANDDGAIVKVPRDGGAPVPLVCGRSTPVALAIDATHVYWVEVDNQNPKGDGRVMKAPLTGGSPTLLARGDTSGQSIAIDDRYVYWGNIREIMKVPLGGGQAERVVEASILNFQLVAGWFYLWELTARDGGIPTRAELVRFPASGGARTTLATTEDRIALLTYRMSFVVDGSAVYWNAGDTINKTSVDDLTTTEVAPAPEQTFLVAVDASFLYYTAPSLFVVPK